VHDATVDECTERWQSAAILSLSNSRVLSFSIVLFLALMTRQKKEASNNTQSASEALPTDIWC
jgi:hypothetical protein